MQDQPVMRMKHVFCRDNPDENGFHGLWRFSRRKTNPIANAQDMRVHRHCRLAESHIQHHIGRLAANTRQLYQLVPVPGTSPS